MQIASTHHNNNNRVFGTRAAAEPTAKVSEEADLGEMYDDHFQEREYTDAIGWGQLGVMAAVTGAAAVGGGWLSQSLFGSATPGILAGLIGPYGLLVAASALHND
jgi:hypothetical protein